MPADQQDLLAIEMLERAETLRQPPTRLTQQERAELDAIFNYVAAHNRPAAQRVIGTIKRSIDRLADFPRSAKPSEIPGIREMPVVRYPYVVFYTVDDVAQEVHILRVRHTSQDPEHHLD